jgi:hypothetical protein
MTCKIERGERRARKEHLPIFSDLLQADKEEFLTLGSPTRLLQL